MRVHYMVILATKTVAISPPGGVSFQYAYQIAVSKLIFSDDMFQRIKCGQKMTPCMSHMAKRSRDHQMCLFSKQLIAHSAVAACSIMKYFCCRALYFLPRPHPIISELAIMGDEEWAWHVNNFSLYLVTWVCVTWWYFRWLCDMWIIVSSWNPVRNDSFFEISNSLGQKIAKKPPIVRFIFMFVFEEFESRWNWGHFIHTATTCIKTHLFRSSGGGWVGFTRT